MVIPWWGRDVYTPVLVVWQSLFLVLHLTILMSIYYFNNKYFLVSFFFCNFADIITFSGIIRIVFFGKSPCA